MRYVQEALQNELQECSNILTKELFWNTRGQHSKYNWRWKMSKENVGNCSIIIDLFVEKL